MGPLIGADLCRITVAGPQRRVDISVPTDIPIAQLLPTVLEHAGENLADSGLTQGGWVLQRLDEAPLDPARTPDQAGLRDGELLYLRPRQSQLPALAFDDVADVVANGIKDRPDRWRPEHTRRFALGAGIATSPAAALIILLSGPPWILPMITAIGLTVVLLLTGIMLSRAGGDSAAGTVFGCAALPHAFLAGALAPARGAMPVGELESQHLLAGFAVVALVAVIAALGVADGLPTFVGLAAAALIGTACTGISLASDLVSAAGVAAVSVAVALALTPLIPLIAFRLARVKLPPVPTSADDLRRDTLTVDGAETMRRTAAADRFVTGMATAISLVGIVAVVPLALSGGTIGRVMCGAVAVALLLRSRTFHGRTQRLWLMGSGMAALLMLAIGAAAGATQTIALAAVLVPLLAFAAAVVAAGLWLPDHRPSPLWGRLADILDMVVVISLVPLAFGVLGIYSAIRGL